MLMIDAEIVVLIGVRPIPRPPDEATDLHVWQCFTEHQFGDGPLIVTDRHQDHAIVGEKITGDDQSAIEELQPNRGVKAVAMVLEVIVVDPTLVPCVEGRVDVNALYLAPMGHPQPSQSVVVVPLDHQIVPGCSLVRQANIDLGDRESVLFSPGMVKAIVFPNQAKLLRAIPRLKQVDQLGLAEVLILAGSNSLAGLSAVGLACPGGQHFLELLINLVIGCSIECDCDFLPLLLRHRYCPF